MREITLSRDDLGTIVDEGSIVIITGTSESGERVIFAGDARPMRELVNGIVNEGEVVAEVEDYQILGRAQ